jgi:hypothetical protein
MVHPVLGTFDYEYKPDQWVNVDGDIIVAPLWQSTKTLRGSVNTFWEGDISEVICEERWLSSGGMAMPVSQFRMLYAMWTTPVDPDVGYIQWFPNYANGNGYNVIISDMVCGAPGNSSMARQSGIGYFTLVLDDVVNYLGPDGENEGWATLPVSLFLKIVSKV